MNLSKLITHVASMRNISESNSVEKSNIKRAINLAYKNFCSRYRWSFLKRKQSLSTIVTYKAGAATATYGSRTVTGVGTNWVGLTFRYFRMGSNQQWYKIASVGGASLTLELPYIQVSSSGPYEIWARYYELNTDVKDVTNMYIDGSVRRILRFPEREGMGFKFNRLSTGTPPEYWIEVAPTKNVYLYSAGVVSGAINTRTLTGIGTLWLDTVNVGDSVKISTSTYNVYTVDNDTQLTLCQNLNETITTAAYLISRKENKRIQFDKAPSDYGDIITYDYIKYVYDMDNNLDEPEIPEALHEIILLGAIYEYDKMLDDVRESQDQQKYELAIEQAYKKSDANSGDQPDQWYFQEQSD